MEIIDIFDEHMNPIGTMEKDEAHKKNQWHKNVHIWITNGKSVLMQKRCKPGLFNGAWVFAVGGHFRAGETLLDATKREFEEELGLKWTFGEANSAVYLKTTAHTNGSPVYEHRYIVCIKANLKTSDIKLCADEASSIKWVPYDKFVHMLDTVEIYKLMDSEYKDTIKRELWKLIK